MRLATDRCRLAVDPSAGGRLSSLVIDGHELLVNEPRTDPLRWGAYPMAPWAGRIRDGRFRHAGREVELPTDVLPPHAIHGTAYVSEWARCDDALVLDLGPPWPFGGRLTQRFDLRPGRLAVELTLTATDRSMPAVLGWHPWFRRDLGGGQVTLRVDPAGMYERGADGLPTGRIATPGPRPWDDCCIGLAAPPRLDWPELVLEIDSDAGYWVVYDAEEHAVCVEPQTGPPDAFNLGGVRVLAPGETMTATMELRWGGIDR